VERELRNTRIKNFQTSKGGSVFLIQIKAGGQGLNLQEATRVYITTPSWNPATEMQAIARSHRTGQTQKVVVRKLVYTGTEELPSIEETMMALQNHKSTVCAEVLNDPRLATQIPVASKNVSIRDIKKIFRV
jgi:SNF2 family DNA or RNA helicase